MTLADMSNVFVYASMVAFTISVVAFSIALAKGRRLETLATSADRNQSVNALSRLGATATLEQAAVTTAQVGAGGRKSGNIGMSLTWFGTLLLGAGLLTRGLSAKRLPWGNMYEFSLAAAFAVALAYCVLSLRRDLRWLGVFIAVPILLDLGLAVTVLYTESAPLVPALRSYWLAIHVSAAIICMGAFTIGAALSALYLISARVDERINSGEPAGRLGGFASRLPAADRLDLMAYQIHAFMMPLWTFSVIAGAIWAEAAWGRYWGWDPKETWAFITWVIYAAYLHARSTAGWRGRKAAWIAILGYGAIIFNYFIVNMYVQGLHSYSGLN
jgi:cytochrome c-type biogenesis protein CcsB